MERTPNTRSEKWERCVTFPSEVSLCKLPFVGSNNRKQRNCKRISNKSSVKRGIWLSRLRIDGGGGGGGGGLLPPSDCIKVCDYLYQIWDSHSGDDEE